MVGLSWSGVEWSNATHRIAQRGHLIWSNQGYVKSSRLGPWWQANSEIGKETAYSNKRQCSLTVLAWDVQSLWRLRWWHTRPWRVYGTVHAPHQSSRAAMHLWWICQIPSRLHDVNGVCTVLLHPSNITHLILIKAGAREVVWTINVEQVAAISTTTTTTNTRRRQLHYRGNAVPTVKRLTRNTKIITHRSGKE